MLWGSSTLPCRYEVSEEIVLSNMVDMHTLSRLCLALYGWVATVERRHVGASQHFQMRGREDRLWEP